MFVRNGYSFFTDPPWSLKDNESRLRFCRYHEQMGLGAPFFIMLKLMLTLHLCFFVRVPSSHFEKGHISWDLNPKIGTSINGLSSKRGTLFGGGF